MRKLEYTQTPVKVPTQLYNQIADAAKRQHRKIIGEVERLIHLGMTCDPEKLYVSPSPTDQKGA